MEHAVSNRNGQIWFFWNKDIDSVVIEEDEQQITSDISHNEIQTHFTTTFVYAKCKDQLRRPLWDRMLFHAAESSKPWCLVGDYNVITSMEEKLGGIPYNMRKSLDFIAVIETCGLIDLGFNGQRFTWSNKRGTHHRIWKRLDRAMVNDKWLETMQTEKIVRSWSKREFGDVFVKVKEYEEKVRKAEENLIQDHTEKNRTTLHELNAKYIRFLKMEDSILKQKTQLQWFKEGDANTKYFHSLIRGKRRRLFIHKLISEGGEWIQGDDNIAEAACGHFQTIFIGEDKVINENVLNCIPRMVN
ncbi:uncharacterized protein LOC125829910 [Solanum verrucosum]|uniref:uncharacterized protein LOC125829910 n=1 Tax=Solanum verrucosum TaxID=315347 RepID=UPI0020D10D7E|nr:uncharacterized protein LOC125829910 [Solanum verrucosum]